MIIYNVTVKVDLKIATDWQKWMLETHIPDVLKTGLFTGNRMLRLLEQDESEGITFSIQYELRNMADYMTYQHEFAPALQKDHSSRYKDRFIAFRTLMRTVE